MPRVHGCIGIYFGKYIEYGLQKESLLCACWKRYRRNCEGTHCGNHRFPQSGHVVRYGEKRAVSCLHDPPDALCMYMYIYTGCLRRTIASNDTLGYIGMIIAIVVYTEWSVFVIGNCFDYCLRVMILIENCFG